ncbi:MAG: hypothetical protein JKY51_05920 [Opitutaceae bacterium]|nr:hypothetical protein [Opitutaceae bacterium]
MNQSTLPYLSGVSIIDVTPPGGSKLAGFGHRTEDSTNVYLPLRCIITAITDCSTEKQTIIVSIEWLGFYDNTDHVRDLITAATGIPNDNILLCGSHTHCGPPMRKKIDKARIGGIDEPFLESVFQRIAQAAKVAVDAQEPTRLRYTTGCCGFAHSRRRPIGNGKIEWMPTLDAPHDHSVPVLLFEDDSGKLKHLLFGYACHPTASGAILEIGGDYVGFAMIEVEEHLGCTAGFIQGCAGDQKPYRVDPECEGFPQYPIDEIHAFGNQLAQSVANAVRFNPLDEITGEIKITSQKISLKTTVLPRQEYEAFLDNDNSFLSNWAKKHLETMDRGEAPATDLPFELQTIEFGTSLVMVAMPGEMSVEHGLRLIKEQGSRFQNVWPIAYSNKIVGYVCSRRQLSEGGYEVLTNMQIIGLSGPLEEKTEDQIHQAIAEMLQSH